MTDFDLGTWRPSRADRREEERPDWGTMYRQFREDAERAQNDFAMRANMTDAFDSINERIRTTTGEVLDNPFNGSAPTAYDRGEVGPGFGGVIKALDPMTEWRRRIGELKAKHPDKLDWDGLLAEPERAALARMNAVRTATNQMSDAIGMADPKEGALGGVPVLGSMAAFARNVVANPSATSAQLAGSLVGSLASAPDAAGNMIGFGLPSAAARSLLKNAVTNAVSNAGVQALLSAGKQEDYRKAGLPYGWNVWLEDVEGAAGMGAALDLGVRAPARAAARRLFPEVRRGGLLTDAVEDATPTPRVREPIQIDPDTAAKAKAGDIAATRTILEQTGDIARPEVRFALEHMEGGGRLSDEAREQLSQMGVPRADGMRLLADVIAGRESGAVPIVPGSSRPADPDGGLEVMQRMEQLNDVLREMPIAVRQQVEDGLEVGHPAVVEAARTALDGPRETLPARLAEIITPEVATDIAIRAGRLPVLDVAELLRQRPDLAVDVDTRLVQHARALARLDDDAYAMVRGGEVPADLAAMVGDRVPAGRQARMLRDLERMRPASLDEAAGLIDQLAPEPPRQDRAPLSPGKSAIEDPQRMEALRGEAGAAYEQAMEPIRRREKLEAEIETRRGQIAELERKPVEYKDPDTGELISEGDVNAVVDMWRYVREMRRQPKPKSIIDFIRDAGGIRDEGGDVRHLIGESRQRPGLLSKQGMDPDAATLAAWEAGYLGSGERPSVNALYDAIDNDVAGNRVYSDVDASRADDLRMQREMEGELGRYGLERARTEADILAYFGGGKEGAGGDPALARSQEIARARQDLARLEQQLADTRLEIDPSPDGRALYDLAMRSAALRREADLQAAVMEALAIGRRMVPEGARIEVKPDEAMVYRKGKTSQQLDAMSDVDTGHISLALGAVDPAAKLGHEAVHTLVTLGHLAPTEVDALAALAREAGTLKNEEAYRKAYKDRPEAARQIEEEAAASYIEARIKGEVDGPTNTVVERIRQLLERIRQLLAGYGFQSREDVVQAIMSGDAARRQARAEWRRDAATAMRREDITAAAVKDGQMFAFAGERAKTADTEALARAKAMADASASRDDIWRETGWFKGVDGKWRFEIADKYDITNDYKEVGAFFRNGPGSILHMLAKQQVDDAILVELMQHENLMRAYPDVADVRVMRSGQKRGASYGYSLIDIGYSHLDQATKPKKVEDIIEPMQVMMHEVQHAIQDIEGTAKGGSPAAEQKRLESVRDQQLDAINEEVISMRRSHPNTYRAFDEYKAAIADQRWEDANAAETRLLAMNGGVRLHDLLFAYGELKAQRFDGEPAFAAYHRLAGEVEARTVEKRLSLTEAERRERPPWRDYDVPESEQVVRGRVGALFALRTDQMGDLDLSKVTTEADAERLLVERFGFRSAKVEPGQVENAQETLRLLDAISKVTGATPAAIGSTAGGSLVVTGWHKHGDSGSFSLWGRSIKLHENLAGNAVVHEWAHAFDAASRGRRLFRRGPSTDKEPLGARIAAGLIWAGSFAATGLPIVGVGTIITAALDRLLFRGRYTMNVFRRRYPWMSSGVAQGFEDLAAALGEGESGRFDPKTARTIEKYKSSIDASFSDLKKAGKDMARTIMFEKVTANEILEAQTRYKQIQDKHETLSTEMDDYLMGLPIAIRSALVKDNVRYYVSPPEIFARAFEVYVEMKSAALGLDMRGAYGSGQFGKGLEYLPRGSPQTARVVSAFDKIFSAMRYDEQTGRALFALRRNDLEAVRYIDERAAVNRPRLSLRHLFDPQMRPDGYVDNEPFQLSNVRIASKTVANIPIGRVFTIQESVSVRATKDKLTSPVTDDGRPPSVFKYGDEYFVNDGNHRIQAARARGDDEIRAEVIELVDKSPDVLEDHRSPDTSQERMGSHAVDQDSGLYAIAGRPPEPPIKAGMASVDSLNRIGELIEACR